MQNNNGIVNGDFTIIEYSDHGGDIHWHHDSLSKVDVHADRTMPGLANELYDSYVSDGNDQLYAEEKIGLAELLNSDTDATTITRDWLAGGSGDDLLVGSHGENGLAGGGGGGDDVILAGAGDDNIFGDHDWFATELDWSYAEVNGRRIFQPILGEKNPPDSGADIIHAGTGDDHVWAGAGDDVVLGG